MTESRKLFSVTIPQLNSIHRMEENLNDDFFMTSHIVEYSKMLEFPLRLDAFIVGVCLKGQLKITINLKEWELSKNSCVISLPENVIGLQKTSADFQGVIMAISIDYLKDMHIDLKNIMPYYVLVRNYPCVQIEAADIDRLVGFYDLIGQTVKDGKSSRKEEIVKHLFSAFIFKIVESLDRINSRKQALKTKSKEYYFIRFTELLQKDFRTHRNVGHYSDKLIITPKYLSALIKEISGSSAAEWIDEYLIAEASILLKFSDKNIQQIADELNFPSQSFFSKFFKQHTGKTPTEYREVSKN